MQLGFSELILIFLIALILIGPQVISFLQRWHRRANRAANSARKQVRAAAKETDQALTRLWISLYAGLALAAVGFLLYLALHTPDPVPLTWAAAAPQPLSATASLADAPALPLSWRVLCAQEREGWLYAVLEKGQLWRCRTDGTSATQLWQADGELAALAFAPDGSLILACTGNSGGGAILRVTADDWGLSPETLTAAACPLAVAVAADGTVYYTSLSEEDASRGGLAQAATAALLAHSRTGCVYAQRPGGAAELVAGGFTLPAGLALDESGETLYVSDAATGTVYALNAALRGGSADSRAVTPFLTGLPGRPAGLAMGADGRLWVALAGEPNWVERAGQNPFLRKLALNLPAAWQPRLAWGGAGGALAVDTASARVTAFWQSETGVYAVWEGESAVYLSGERLLAKNW